MPFAMIHLKIADKILKAHPDIECKGDFLLGNLSPDAVHYRQPYNSSMKFNSHLCVGDEKWGSITNNDQWLDNVIEFNRKHSQSPQKDFILGYCCHVIADIQNNIKIWTPFKERILINNTPHLGKQYHEESEATDNVLFYEEASQAIIKTLVHGKGIEMINLVSKDEINQMHHAFLNERYLDRPIESTGHHEIIKRDEIECFIDETTHFIMSILF